MSSLSSLLDKANKDKKKSLLKDEQKEYRTELYESFKNNGLSDENVYYFVSGIKFGTVNTFVNWNRPFDADKQLENLSLVISNPKVKSLDNAGKLRMFLLLLVAELNENVHNDGIIGELLHWMVELSYKKDGTRLSDLGKIFRNNFMSGMKPVTKLPVLSSFNFSKEYEKSLICFFIDAIKGVDPKGDEEIAKRNILKKWIDRECANIAQQIQAKTAEESEAVTPQSHKEEVSEAKSEAPKPVEITSVIGKKLFEMAKAMDVFDAQFRESQELLKQKEREIARIKTACDKLEALYKDGADENEKLRKELSSLSEQLEVVRNEKKELEDRVSRQVSVIDVYDQDKANTKTELLNQIASALKKIYADYKVAESMDMTIDLGLNMRDSLDDVFRKLKKIGVDIEGR